MTSEPEARDAFRRARRSVAAMIASDTASAGAGITVEAVAPGQAQARMAVTEGMLNGHGTCHGGYLFLLADTAFACACNTHGYMTFAASASIVFAAPVRSGEILTALALERTAFGRNGVYDVTVTRASGEVVAEFRGQSRMTSVSLLDGVDDPGPVREGRPERSGPG